MPHWGAALPGSFRKPALRLKHGWFLRGRMRWGRILVAMATKEPVSSNQAYSRSKGGNWASGEELSLSEERPRIVSHWRSGNPACPVVNKPGVGMEGAKPGPNLTYPFFPTGRGEILTLCCQFGMASSA